MHIKLNDVLHGVVAGGVLEGLHRVLWIREGQENEPDLLVTIPIQAPRKAEQKGKGRTQNRYWIGPKKTPLCEALEAVERGDVVITQLELPPMVYLTDPAIRKLYPERTTATKRKKRTDCAALQTRDRLWSLIEPVTQFIKERPSAAFETGALSAVIENRLKETGRPRPELLSALHQFLALACGRNSLLPGTARCGAREKTRKLKKAIRLGRKNAAFLAGRSQSPGINLTERDRSQINLGWRTLLKDRMPVRQAYVLTMGAWWRSGVKIESGKPVPILLPPEQRPTLRQFRYWGPKAEDGESAFNLLLRPNEYEKKYRPMLGSAMDGVRAIGQLAIMDSTSTDQTLVSMVSPLDAVGTCNRNVIHEGLSDVIVGIYCGFEAPSGLTALLTILNAASDKVEFCRRFGIEITADQFPSVFFFNYRLDNGEARTQEVIELISGLGSAMEFVERDRPERKPAPESGHRTLHRLLDVRGDGRTNGRQRARGENHSAVGACWTWYVYMRELLMAIIYYNCRADASALMRRHPFRTEMARDGVPPSRAAIYAWCVKNNRIATPPCDFQLLRAMVLPRIKAVVKQNGVFLIRPDRGNKIELVAGARFSGPRALELGWHHGASKPIYIEVKHDPNDLSRVWYADHLGLHPLDNLCPDLLLKREGTLADHLSVQDAQLVLKVATQNERDQGLSDVVAHIVDTNLERRAIKRKAIKQQGRKVSKRELAKDIEKNRALEQQRLASLIDPITRTPLTPIELEPAMVAPSKEMLEPIETPEPDTTNALDAALTQFRNSRNLT